jgi:hypothetical protein
VPKRRWGHWTPISLKGAISAPPNPPSRIFSASRRCSLRRSLRVRLEPLDECLWLAERLKSLPDFKAPFDLLAMEDAEVSS